jgi:hypothetical protein
MPMEDKSRLTTFYVSNIHFVKPVLCENIWFTVKWNTLFIVANMKVVSLVCYIVY